MRDGLSEQECGLAFDHDEVVTYDGPDGIQWYCRRCGGEGFTEPETTPTASNEGREG